VSSRTDPTSGNKGEILFTGAGDVDECDSDVDDFFLKYDFLFLVAAAIVGTLTMQICCQ
jgi:hypothetical protein